MSAEFNIATSRQYGDAGFRLGAIYWLAACNDGMTLPEELAEDFDAECWEQAFGGAAPEGVRGQDVEEIAGELIDRRCFGFLARVDVVLPVRATRNGFTTHGYGFYAMRWVYAETIEELLAKAVEQKEGVLQRHLTRLRAGNAGGEANHADL